ncbi:FAD/NAD(P)-binding domain-containing protein [Nemania abortiva]|nr:FAD/NAD(P)-binding domain-containing protein [Nemania abortiva]
MADTPFRVIVIGAGPIGLFMAHALHAAKIDCVVLEQRSSIISNPGASIVIWPHGCRLLDQLGLFATLREQSTPMKIRTNLLENGRVILSYPMWQLLQEHHGYPSLTLARSELLRVLYEALPDKKHRVRAGAALKDIKLVDGGAEVHLTDGTVELASVVIGADGVHSKTREIMETLANRPRSLPPPMVASFYGIYGHVSNQFGLESGMFYETRGSGIAMQLIVTPEKLFFSLLKPLPKPKSERIRFTRNDIEEFAQSCFTVSLAPNLKFKDIWAVADKDATTLVAQEEGLAQLWHYDRIVLLGDSVHKMTSINGLGANCGMNSAAVLANELQKLLSFNPNPSLGELDDAFARYKRFRVKEAKALHDNGHSTTRRVAWSSWADWFIDRVVSPWMNMGTMMEKYIYPMVKSGQILSYVPFEGKQGQIPWRRLPEARL